MTTADKIRSIIDGKEPQVVTDKIADVITGHSTISIMIALTTLMEHGIEMMAEKDPNDVLTGPLSQKIADVFLQYVKQPTISNTAAEAISAIFKVSPSEAREYMTSNTGSYHKVGDNHVWMSGAVLAEILKQAGAIE